MRNRLKVVYLPKNVGHGNARRKAVSVTTNKLVAIMDADDIALPKRFEYQLREIKKEADIDIIGGQITEFIDYENNIMGRRVVPEKDEDIKLFLRRKCPFNQVTVLFNKDSVECAGGYLDWYCNEDYYLWIRMFEHGCKFANVEETLVNVRVGKEMSARRGGWKYFISEAKLQLYMYKKNIISFWLYVYNIGIRFAGQIILPNFLRKEIYKLLRDHSSDVKLEEVDDVNDLDELRKIPFSVTMCVYNGDRADWFDRALRSISIEQSVKPWEIVLVVDGPINEDLQKVIDKYKIEIDAME